MSLGQRLEIRQGQGLVITPQLQHERSSFCSCPTLSLRPWSRPNWSVTTLLLREDGDPAGENGTDPGEGSREERGELELSDRDTIQANSDLDASEGDVYGDDAPSVREPAPAADMGDGLWSTGPRR